MLQKAQPIPVSVPMLAIFLKIHLKNIKKPYMFFFWAGNPTVYASQTFMTFFENVLFFCSSDLMSSPPQRAPPGI